MAGPNRLGTQNLGDFAPGAHAVALTIPAGTKGLLLAVMSADEEEPADSWNVGGVGVPALGWVAVSNQSGCGFRAAVDISGRSDDTLDMSVPAIGGNYVRVVAYYYAGSIGFGAMSGVWEATVSEGETVSVSMAVPVGSVDGFAQVVECQTGRDAGSLGTVVPTGTSTGLAGTRINGMHEYIRSVYKTISATASFGVTHTALGFYTGVAAVAVYLAEVELTPDTAQVNVTVLTEGLSIDVVTDVMLNQGPPVPVEVRVLTDGLAITTTGPRQVSLVGEGPETVEMTEGGAQGQALAYNAASKPSWGATLEALLTDETDTALVPHPDGTGGVEWGEDANDGGGSGMGVPIVRVYTANDTWARPAGLVAAHVRVQGGGGGAGGSTTTAAGQTSTPGGGGGGGYSEKVFDAADLPATCTVTVGAAGAAGTAGNTGGTGGDSTFAGSGITTVQGNGGVGSATSTPSVASFGVGAFGGAASGGDIDIHGGDGSWGLGHGASVLGRQGDGGGSAMAGTRRAGGAPMAGYAYGGGAAAGAIGASTAGAAGAAGAAGVVIVTEFY